MPNIVAKGRKFSIGTVTMTHRGGARRASVFRVPALRVLVLSPHRDDAAFSCGLLMLALARVGAAITVANVCTRSDYAPYLEDIGADRITDVTAARAEEDRHFARELAAAAHVPDSVRWIDMQWRDAPLRRGIETEQVLQQHGLQANETAELMYAMRRLPEADVMLTPLALGNHVDHLLVRESARATFGSGNIFYEDLPYACRMTSGERAEAVRRLAGLQPWTPPVAVSTGNKRRFAMCYPSQIAPDVAGEMEEYAAALGGRERLFGEDAALQLLHHALSSGPASR